MVIKCLCFDGVKNSENCTFRFRKLYVSFSRLYTSPIYDVDATKETNVVMSDSKGWNSDSWTADED